MTRVGVVGLGVMGMNHLRVLHGLGVDCYGFDLVESRIQMGTKKYGMIGCGSLNELLARVDAVVVSTPSGTHKELVMQCLDAGCHVLVEKPLCDNLHDCLRVQERVRECGVVCGVGHIERYNPVVQYMKKHMGGFGTPLSLVSRRVSDYPMRISDVGVIFDFSIHDVDVMRYLVGDVRGVYAETYCFTPGKLVEDYAFMLLDFNRGCHGLVEVNWLTPVKTRLLVVTFDDRVVTVDYMDQSIISTSSEYKGGGEVLFDVPVLYHVDSVGLRKMEPLMLEVQDFLGVIERGGRMRVDVDDGVEVVRVLEAAQMSADKQCRVKL